MTTEREPEKEQTAWPEEEGVPEEADGDSQESLSEAVRRITATLTSEQDDTSVSGLPRQPRTFVDVGLSKAFLTDLTLKIIHYSGNPTAAQLMLRLGLSQGIVQQLIAALTEERLCEVVGQSDLYTGNYRYRLTDRGQARVAEALERTRYAGPAPVTADQYAEAIRKQQQSWRQASRGKVKETLAGLVLSNQVADSIARALFSGQTTILYGPSGNGKTSVLERFASNVEGETLVPYAIYAHGQVIRVFDPSVHRAVENLDESNSMKDDAKMDRRWLRVKRPAIIVGVELGEESLDLAYDPLSRFHQAPPHIKAQGGVLIVDDFGRQKVGSRDLLARWLIPLERGWDTLTLATGEKVTVPFNLQLLLATNLPLRELADEALLRRILYKLELPSPTPAEFADILKRLCHRRRVLVPEGSLDHVIKRLYQESGIEPRAAYARDLLEIVIESARFDAREPVLSPEAFDRAFRLFMAERGQPKNTSQTA